MNVFQDLVDELKEENLLEETVPVASFDRSNALSGPAGSNADAGLLDASVSGVPASDLPAEEGSPVIRQGDFEAEPAPTLDEAIERNGDLAQHDLGTSDPPQAAAEDVPKQPGIVKKDKEFFKKRASAEVSSLQMVDHVLAGIEREYLKVVAKPFDDFNVKKALNIFLQSSEAADAERYLAAEYDLLRETEAWCIALAERDRVIKVMSLRQFVDNSKPALSSQAMLGLARFYRNLPYTEDVRAKFDFIITRLFSKSIGMERRACLFDRDEMLGHINALYEEWASVPLYAADEDDESKLLLTALSFADLADEAENAATFDQLLKNEFFERLRMFKESIRELFFAPNVIAAAIEANIRIGNAYVSLIERERDKMDAELLESKFAVHDHETISDATARSLNFSELLKARRAEEDYIGQSVVDGNIEPPVENEPVADPAPRIETKARRQMPALLSGLLENAFAVNKWLFIMSFLLVAGAVGVYIWGNYVVREEVSTAGVAPVAIQNAALAEHIKVAKLSGENLYLQMNSSWDALPKEKRQDYLQSLMQEAPRMGFKQVTLIGSSGKYAGFVSANRIDVVMP